mmetsp:Transcript_34492/g.75462  ORF Transcript_34492/g.75462 Transcript_34492/m.75462 type:complete len:267 (-) Transcript_34492:996-1796(-)
MQKTFRGRPRLFSAPACAGQGMRCCSHAAMRTIRKAAAGARNHPHPGDPRLRLAGQRTTVAAAPTLPSGRLSPAQVGRSDLHAIRRDKNRAQQPRQRGAASENATGDHPTSHVHMQSRQRAPANARTAPAAAFPSSPCQHDLGLRHYWELQATRGNKIAARLHRQHKQPTSPRAPARPAELNAACTALPATLQPHGRPWHSTTGGVALPVKTSKCALFVVVARMVLTRRRWPETRWDGRGRGAGIAADQRPTRKRGALLRGPAQRR